MEKNNDVILEELIKKDASESMTAYAAFLFWANLSASERRDEDALMRTAEHVGLELSTLKVYRVEFRWDERVNMIDAHFFNINFQRRLDLTDVSNQKFATDAKEIQEEAIQVSKLALAAARQVLETFPMANKVIESEFVLVKQADGSHMKRAMKTEIKMEAKLSDAASLIRVAVDTPMKAIGLPTETVSTKVSKQVAPINQMTDDDIAEQQRRIADEIQKLRGGDIQNLPGNQ